MLGIFLILTVAAFISAISKGSRRPSQKQLPLPNQIDADFQAAQLRQDHAALIQYYRLALEKPLSELDKQLIRINLAYSFTALEQYEQSLLELDRVSLKNLPPNQVALWLNNRAYVLSKIDRFEEGLDHLQDAQELLIGADGTTQDSALAACINSTRGLIFLKQGDLERAEKALQLALQLEANLSTRVFESISQGAEGDPHRTAERWYWLSEIANLRGNETLRLMRLERSARYPQTEYGSKSVQLLRPYPEFTSRTPWI